MLFLIFVKLCSLVFSYFGAVDCHQSLAWDLVCQAWQVIMRLTFHQRNDLNGWVSSCKIHDSTCRFNDKGTSIEEKMEQSSDCKISDSNTRMGGDWNVQDIVNQNWGQSSALLWANHLRLSARLFKVSNYNSGIPETLIGCRITSFWNGLSSELPNICPYSSCQEHVTNKFIIVYFVTFQVFISVQVITRSIAVRQRVILISTDRQFWLILRPLLYRSSSTGLMSF